MHHYTDYKSFTESFIGFSDYAREEGLKVGLKETIQSLITSLIGLWGQPPYFQYALAAIFCTNDEERKIFDRIFNRFWNERGTCQKSKITLKNQNNPKKKNKTTLAMKRSGEGQSKNSLSAKTTSGANKMESLRKTDFGLVSKVDDQLLEELCEQLVKEMSLRIRRKYKKGTLGQVDIARTIRHSLQEGGNFIKLHYKEKKKEKVRLVILLDVSGSMDKYSFYLLRFIWTLRAHFKHIEGFTFSTKLLRITDHLNQRRLNLSLLGLSHEADHWSSGTKIGECLKQFNDTFGKKVLNGRSLTIILSDGLDTGETQMLEQQLRRIKLRTNKLIWLNPLKGMNGYQPIQKGMKAALPQLDVFESAHNLESLLTLENIIAHA